MKQSKLVGVIKMSKRTKETVWAHNQYSYTKTKRHTNEEVSDMEQAAKQYLSTHVEEARKREYQCESIESILERIDQRTRSYEFSRHLDRCEEEAMRKYRAKFAPKTKAQAWMDAVGIDRFRIYELLCEIEKCFE